VVEMVKASDKTDLEKQFKKAFPVPAVEQEQYDLFSSVCVPNGVDEKSISNLISQWDLLPKYAVSRAKQTAMRRKSPTGELGVYEREITDGNTVTKITIKPAKIYTKNGKSIEYYPSDNEEIIEFILRRIFLDSSFGSHLQANDGSKSWCKFTLNLIKSELKKINKTRDLNEIKLSLEILHRCNIEITVNGKSTYSGAIFPEQLLTNREEYDSKRGEAVSSVRFSSIISTAIDNFKYRQYNDQKMMDMDTPLGRWLYRYLSDNYTNAGRDARPYKLRYSEVKNLSGLLDNNVPARVNITELEKAFKVLEKNDVLKSECKRQKKGPSIVDAEFTLTPTDSFIQDVIAANVRQKELRNIESSRKAKKEIHAFTKGLKATH
jgi:hypothetical protein